MAGNPKIAALLAACRVLSFEQRQLAAFTGTSVRTVQRWYAGQGSPDGNQVARLAAAVYAKSPDVAGQLAASVGRTLQDLVVVPRSAPAPVAPSPSPPPEPAPLRPHLVQAVVAAAAEALEVSPRVVRPAVLAAMESASATGLTVEDVLTVLRPPSTPKRAPRKSD